MCRLAANTGDGTPSSCCWLAGSNSSVVLLFRTSTARFLNAASASVFFRDPSEAARFPATACPDGATANCSKVAYGLKSAARAIWASRPVSTAGSKLGTDLKDLNWRATVGCSK